MKFRILSWATAFLAVWLGAPLSTPAANKTVLMHYMPWFVAQPYSGVWGWHWTMNHFDPARVNPTNGQREIASRYYPLIGPYDSADPAVLEYHVLLMKLAGIDGVIVDWYGTDNFNDYAVNNTRTLALFDYTRQAGLKFSLCYEDATIQQEINGNFITAAGAIAHARQTMLYAQSNFFNDPTFLRWNSRPVLLNFGPQYFHTSANWASIFSGLVPSCEPAFFTEDNRLEPRGTGAFDWPPMYLSRTNAQSSAIKVLSPGALTDYLTKFEEKGKACPASVSSAFPRFYDIYAQAGVEPSFGFLDDRNGATFRETLARALTNASPFIQVVTWNDFGEGTVVEPTVQYGYRDLTVMQDFRRRHLDANFAFHTRDLDLPLRLYNLRKQYGATNPVLSAEMDRIFTHIVSSNLSAAELELAGIESSVPLIYNATATNGQVQFSIGGFVAGTNIKVESTSVFAPDNWQTVTTFATSTNMIVFSDALPPNSPGMFFRVQGTGP